MNIYRKAIIAATVVLCSACSEPVDTNKLKVIEVQLISASAGYRRNVNVEILDKSRDMKFSETIVCESWDSAEKLKSRTGEFYKIYDSSTTVVPSYYRLSDRLCPN